MEVLWGQPSDAPLKLRRSGGGFDDDTAVAAGRVVLAGWSGRVRCRTTRFVETDMFARSPSRTGSKMKGSRRDWKMDSAGKMTSASSA
jgi:hypothetical protein